MLQPPVGSSSVVRPRRVAVLARDELLASGLASLLEASGVQAVAITSPAQAEETAEPPEAIVWIADHADSESLERLWALRERHGVMLCAIARTLDLRALRRLLPRGSDGLALLLWRGELGVTEVYRTLRQLTLGSVVLDPAVLEQLVVDTSPERERLLGRLSTQELAVLELMAMGLRNRAIAERLGRSEKLVEKHVGRIFSKLELDPRVEPDVDRRVRASRLFLLSDRPAPAAPAPPPSPR